MSEELNTYSPGLNGTAFAGMFSAVGLYTGDDHTFYLAADVDAVMEALRARIAALECENERLETELVAWKNI